MNFGKKYFAFALATSFLTTTVVLFQNFSPAPLFTEPLRLHIAVDGDPRTGNGSEDDPFQTLDHAELYLRNNPTYRDVEILIHPGIYYCRAKRTDWTYVPQLKDGTNRYKVTIRAYGNVESPASPYTMKDPDRPAFIALQKDGTPCSTSPLSPIWLVVTHARNAVNLTVKDIRISHYRGGISIQNENLNGQLSRIDQNVVIDNVVFDHIGDKHFPHDDIKYPGKGAILLTRTHGNTIKNNLFWYVNNNYSTDPKLNTDGLQHGIYFTTASSRNTVTGNAFRSISASAIKITDFSNHNTFSHNIFETVNAGIVDRWCGAGVSEADDICRAEKSNCASWENVVDASSSTFVNIGKDSQGREYRHVYAPLYAGYDCRHEEPTTWERMIIE